MKGIVPSLNTPFAPGGAVDHDALRRLVDHTIAAGCGGMLGLAVAGEHWTLTPDEKLRYIETVSVANAGRIPFIVSVTAPAPTDSLALAKHAKAAGATGICVQIPDGYEYAETLAFLQDLERHGPDVLMVQDLDWTGDGLPIDQIVALFEQVEAFTWLKIETQGAGPKYSAVLQATGGALNVCGGWAVRQLMDAMARGVHAFIPTGMERVYVAIHRLYQQGDIATAGALFDKVLPVLEFSNQHIEISIRFFKDLRKAEGVFDTNLCRIAPASGAAGDGRDAAAALATALALIDEYAAPAQG